MTTANPAPEKTEREPVDLDALEGALTAAASAVQTAIAEVTKLSDGPDQPGHDKSADTEVSPDSTIDAVRKARAARRTP